VNLVVTLPLKIESTANLREHWRKRAHRASIERNGVHLSLKVNASIVPPKPPLVVTLTRIAPRELDSDNNVAAFKACRDGIADWLGVNDNDKRIEWVYRQEKGAPKHYACRIEVKA
jgi:crossover junction endodeoxyribonuclease RusA